MAGKKAPAKFTREIADLIASNPTREQILAFHPSKSVQQRASHLLEKLRSNSLSSEEQWELDQFQHAESLVQLIKARLQAARAS